MQLEIDGIGKIQKSKIELRGITVIAGENNTGKSTFSKTLYCMFNTFYNANEAIYNAKRTKIKNTILDLIRQQSRRPYYLGYSHNASFDEIIDRILAESKPLIDDIQDIFTNIAPDNKSYVLPNTDDYNLLAKQISEILNLSDDDIQKTIIDRYFNSEFDHQINHLNSAGQAGKIIMTIHNKNIEVNILNNECYSFMKDLEVQYDAIYIDTPFVVDELLGYLSPQSGLTRDNNHRLNLLGRLITRDSNDIVETTIMRQKLSNIISLIDPIVNGMLTDSNRKDYMLARSRALSYIEKGLKKPLSLANVSAGIKTFLIIKRLLELGEIKERGVLILDEPEVHLHPAWQLKFAEILILLQKEFNLTILLTTHSPYFLEAIEVYSNQHNIKDRCNYYLSQNTKIGAKVRDVTESINHIYEQLATPFKTLEDITFNDD